MRVILRNVLLICLLGLLVKCDENEVTSRDYPRLRTLQVTDVSTEGVQFNAEIILRGASEIISYGFVWGESESPTKERSNLVSASNLDSDKFSQKILSILNNSKTYYVRSFIETNNYLVYGEIKAFTFGKEPIGELYLDLFSPTSGVDFVELSDGSIMVLGTTSEESITKPFVAKFNDNLTLQWHKIFDENILPGNGSILATSDNSIFITGTFINADLTYQGGIMKTDSSGNLLWKKTHFNGEENNTINYSTVGADGSIISIGSIKSNEIFLEGYVSVLKINENGEQEWQKQFDNELLLNSYNIEPIPSGYLFASASPGNNTNCLECQNYLVITKLSLSGEKIWQNSLERYVHGSGGWPNTIAANSQHIIASNGYTNDYHVFDINGNFIRKGSLEMRNHQKINTTGDGNFINAGGGRRFQHGRPHMSYLNGNGRLIWDDGFGRSCKLFNNYASNAKSLNNGLILVIGTSYEECDDESSLYLAVINKKGEIQ
ncbi:MAG: hypothetical protein ACFB15_09140 [Cyclobacteriaceae bacterium]